MYGVRVNIRSLCISLDRKGIPNVFRAGLRDPYTRDVARLSESVKILELQASVFLRFPKENRATSQVHGSRYPAWKTIW
jgi:hypothetical protein